MMFLFPLPSEIPSADGVYKAIMKFDVLQENSANMLFFYKITKNTLYNLCPFTPCAESLRKYTAKRKPVVYFSLSAGDASSRR